MGAFDIRNDSPNLLRVEALNTTIKFDRLSPTTGLISWNIPSPSSGCSAETQAYCGMLVVIDTTPNNASKKPVDKTLYTADPTADNNLFAGDKIGTSLVIGAFYGDRTTTALEISGLQPENPYYVTGFPVDCEYRYHVDGIHAYSQDITASHQRDGTSGYHKVLLDGRNIVHPSDMTGLFPNTDYTFKLQVGLVPQPKTPIIPNSCVPLPTYYDITIDGIKVPTYQDLVNEISKQIAISDNPYQGLTPANVGVLYWDATNSKLYTWDGYKLNPTDVIIQDLPPNHVATGAYWYNPDTNILNMFNGSMWNEVEVLHSPIDPLKAIPYDTYWFNGTQGYVWNGTVWCETPTYIQPNDPSLTPIIPLGSYWLDTENLIMYRWDSVMDMWIVVPDILEYEEDPTTVLDGTYWYKDDSELLFQRSIGTWINIDVITSTKLPTNPINGMHWIHDGGLYKFDASQMKWINLPMLVYSTDPTQRESCNIWLNTTDDTLYVWNVLNSNWEHIINFYNQAIDPTTVSSVVINSLWYNPITQEVMIWKDNCFKPGTVIISIDDPRNISINDIWHDTTNDLWYQFNGNTWQLFKPLILNQDPLQIASGLMWFSKLTNTLSLWNGLSWINLYYTTQSPIPSQGTKWFKTDDNILYEWDGAKWIISPLKVTVSMDCYGNIVFTDTSTGSLSFVRITDGVEHPLFRSLAVSAVFDEVRPGSDGVSNVPMYKEVGVGTDGTNDERLNLFNNIRYQLGYPVIDVELTNEQLDFCVTKAINELRAKSGLGYRHGYFFLNTYPETQRYLLTNKVSGYNTIVDILSIQRTNNLALGGHDSGIYGQYFANFLYQVGHYDLLSFHIMTEYKKTFEILFSQRIQFNWNEQTRELFIHQRMPYQMYLAVEAVVERSEQDLINDRYAINWIQRYAAALARIILAEIRGKFSTLPGAGGSISLNAAELRSAAKEELDACLLEIETFQADRPETYGMASTFVFG